MRIAASRASKPVAYSAHMSGAGPTDCPFCYPNVLSATPEPRYSRGRTFIFLNKYPFGEGHMVVVPDAYRHVTSVVELSVEDFAVAISLVFDYVGSRAYIGFNSSPAAGASQPHIHLQVLRAGRPASEHAVMDRRCRAYAKRGVNLASELVRLESAGGRVVVERWWGTAFASFAPRFEGEVLAILGGWDPARVGSALYTLVRSLSEAYPGWGINAVAYPPTSCLPPIVSAVLRRPGPSSDIGFLELLLGEPVVTLVPEHHAERLRATVARLGL